MLCLPIPLIFPVLSMLVLTLSNAYHIYSRFKRGSLPCPHSGMCITPTPVSCIRNTKNYGTYPHLLKRLKYTGSCHCVGKLCIFLSILFLTFTYVCEFLDKIALSDKDVLTSVLPIISSSLCKKSVASAFAISTSPMIVSKEG